MSLGNPSVVALLPTQCEAVYPRKGSGSAFTVYQGGFGSGKTHSGWAFGYLRAKQWPGSRGLVCAESYAMVRDTTRVKWLDMTPRGDIRTWLKVPDRLTLKNGSEVWFMQGDGERVKSTEFNWIHIEEGSQLKFEDYQKITSRLRRPPDPAWPWYQPSMLITTNPQETPGWIDREYGPQRKAVKRNRRLIAPTYENVFQLASVPDYVNTLSDTFDEDRQKIYIEGQTGNLGAGAVYHCFRFDRNVSDAVKYSPRRPIHLTFDFNVRFMYACLFQEVGDQVHVVDEIAHKSSTTEDVCKTFVDRYAGVHQSDVIIYGDPAGYHSDTRSTMNDYEIIRRTLGGFPGFRMTVNHNDAAKEEFRVRNRAIAVNNFLDKGRYLISPECTYLIRSISETRWDPNKEGSWKKVKNADPSSDEFVVDHPHDAADYYFAKRWPFRPKDMAIR